MSFKINFHPVAVDARQKKLLRQIWHTGYKDCATLEEAARMLVIDLLKERCDDQFAMNVIKRAKKANEDLKVKEIFEDLKDRKMLSAFIKGFLSEIDDQQKNKNSDSEQSNPGATE